LAGIAALLILHIAFGVWAAIGNKQANRPWQTGFLYGFFLSLLGVTFVWLREGKLSPEAKAMFARLDEYRARRLETVACPRCGMHQARDATACKKCSAPLATAVA